MSELRRWSEEGAGGPELRLVEAGRRDRPNDATRARILAGLGTSAAVTAAGAVAMAGSTGLGIWTKIVLSTVAVVGVGGAVVVASARWNRTPEHAPAAAVSASAAPAPTSVAAPAADSSPIEPPAEAPPAASSAAEDPAPSARPPAPRPRPVHAPSATLSDEVAALEKARRALASSSPEAALRELGRYDKRFPKRALGSEETVLRVQALLARGDHQRAVALADQFTAANPNSPYARRVQELVRAARKK
jgi:hypothetical protein